MPEPSLTPPTAARTARFIVQAAVRRGALDTREQRTAVGRSEHDRGLAILERQRAEPVSESAAAVLASWPDEQRTRLAAELACCGRELPPDVAAALRTGPDA